MHGAEIVDKPRDNSGHEGEGAKESSAASYLSSSSLHAPRQFANSYSCPNHGAFGQRSTELERRYVSYRSLVMLWQHWGSSLSEVEQQHFCGILSDGVDQLLVMDGSSAALEQFSVIDEKSSGGGGRLYFDAASCSTYDNRAMQSLRT